MAPYKVEEAIELVTRTLAALESFPPRVRDDFLGSDQWMSILYEPHPNLAPRFQDYLEWRADKRKEDAGHLMEEIALLLFKGLKGVENIRSFQSYAAQHDLVIDGSSQTWQLLMSHLHLRRNGRSIVVEAKNQDERISDQQFSRLCYIIQNKFEDTADLGVFISRTGASGFPDQTSTQRSLRDSRATQALFHAKTGKYVIVIDEQDIVAVYKGLAFPKLLEAKIREVEASSGIDLSFDEEWRLIELPPHLLKYLK